MDFEEGNFGAASEKIGYAIQLNATAVDYRRVLALRPADAAAKTNLALCEKLLGETGGTPPGHPQQFKLLEALRQQKRLLEAAPLAAAH